MTPAAEWSRLGRFAEAVDVVNQAKIEELRRRVQQDPASIAFAQLAEEYRRAGLYDEAVEVCRAGLAVHPGYLLAHVTLGRALFELGRLDEAQDELELVLTHAPDNLTALRTLADLRHRQGALDEAHALAATALQLAPNDPELEETVAELARQRRPPAPAAPLETTKPAEHAALPAERPDEAAIDPARARALATLTALERWLAAIHVTRAQRHP